MTFSSGFSKTTQASGLKIKPGLRANWVIRKSKSHALGAVEVDFARLDTETRTMGMSASEGGGEMESGNM